MLVLRLARYELCQCKSLAGSVSERGFDLLSMSACVNLSERGRGGWLALSLDLLLLWWHYDQAKKARIAKVRQSKQRQTELKSNQVLHLSRSFLC